MAGFERKGEKQRPDPDALLALANKDARGKLTIFLGAAPGVGKTYAMLSRARSLKADGADIVVGLVETHGRSETAALLDGLEVLPRRIVSYQGHDLEEFDIDAALARRPGIIIVDELAHTNAPESRHPKRYQDVEELIRAGIDVWTAMNIQHLEGLSDVVARITGVAVRETVPDSVLKLAEEVIVVDITPAELIQRLKDGKVYVPDNARRAIDGFFKPATLTALRELALRRTADRVDDQMVDFLRQNVIEGPWATAERLLVCVGSNACSEKLVRAASRLADGLNAPWTAVHVAPRRRRAETRRKRPHRRNAASCRTARRRYPARYGRRFRRRDPAHRPARKRDPDRARPLDLRLVVAPARKIAQRRHHAAIGGYWRAYHRRSARTSRSGRSCCAGRSSIFRLRRAFATVGVGRLRGADRPRPSDDSSSCPISRCCS